MVVKHVGCSCGRAGLWLCGSGGRFFGSRSHFSHSGHLFLFWLKFLSQCFIIFPSSSSSCFALWSFVPLLLVFGSRQCARSTKTRLVHQIMHKKSKGVKHTQKSKARYKGRSVPAKQSSLHASLVSSCSNDCCQPYLRFVGIIPCQFWKHCTATHYMGEHMVLRIQAPSGVQPTLVVQLSVQKEVLSPPISNKSRTNPIFLPIVDLCIDFEQCCNTICS